MQSNRVKFSFLPIQRSLCLAVTLCLAGCASNGFKQYYTDRTGGLDVTKAPNVLVVPQGDPKLEMGSNPDQDAEKMFEEGFYLVGTSSFYGPKGSQSDAIAQGKLVHAAVVLYYSKYKDTINGVRPVTTTDNSVSHSNSTTNASAYAYGTGGYATANGTANTYSTNRTSTQHTDYVPYSVDRHDYFASYWVQRKGTVVGLIVNDLTDDQRRSLASNKGVQVRLVEKRSPAFAADFLKGDIIKKIGDVEIFDQKQFSETVIKYAGQNVKIEFIRDGKKLSKKVQFNEKSF